MKIPTQYSDIMLVFDWIMHISHWIIHFPCFTIYCILYAEFHYKLTKQSYLNKPLKNGALSRNNYLKGFTFLIIGFHYAFNWVSKFEPMG